MAWSARNFCIVIGGAAAQLLVYHALRGWAGLTSPVASVLAGVLVTSACLLVASERPARLRWGLEDYSALHLASFLALMPAARDGFNLFVGLPSDSFAAATAFICLPLLAIQALTRRILFSRAEMESLRGDRIRSRALEEERGV